MSMKYLVIVDDQATMFKAESSLTECSRVFDNEDKARQYVSDLHESHWDQDADQFSGDHDWEEALLFKIEKDGRLTFVDRYELTELDRYGNAKGWRSESRHEIPLGGRRHDGYSIH